jgi:hypothetical protein
MKLSILGLLLITSGAIADDSALANWPSWRGPLNTGVAPLADPPIHWDANANIRWKAPLEGRGSATPIVWGDRIFLVTAIPTDRPGEPPAVNSSHSASTEIPAKRFGGK